jgi:tRNA-specific 2-thiouridylase
MPKVYVGMSGGVDSSLSAALLCEAGYDVTGVYMKNWSQDLPGMKCPWAEDLADAKRVAVQLGIPFKVFDFEAEYKHLVVDYMIAEYQAGRTPNPDIMCNQEVKFGLFLRAALDDGADCIATGHYARVSPCHPREGGDPDIAAMASAEPSKLSKTASRRVFTVDVPENTRKPVERKTRAADVFGSSEDSACLLRAKDSNKDQTYFLYRVTAAALARTIFPIGNLTKPEVRAEAKKRGLLTAGRRESQGICFVGNVGIREFLSQYVESAAGDIVEQESRAVLGRHDGAIFYTFGQRHSLGLGGGLPYYVVGKDMATNQVFVSRNLNNRAFWRGELRLSDVHWINQPPEAGKSYQVRLRHRGELLGCVIASAATQSSNNLSGLPRQTSLPRNDMVVKLARAERAIAPGQSAVIYDGEVVLGGGIIAVD